ncbi:LysM peptidoglycan-binding domain-containing protein [Zooshikella ganghwensis]|uniref:LysM peptidoglycan-binding domain-containing protein n=1 Tax=Zooshikella ganghwensis TaxID=202772 RepID=A0A4P9VJ72_9GAMM|nr:LysM peptidoglycan-binding domain-containing protein [Zooshikella ganghwensis]RDH42267.1 LysM peptidoglycan-binding domain-containing protein [Zooshikella ganghwensis]
MSSNKIYRIQPGDTLATIALKNGVSVDDLRQANPGITDDNLIYANTNIRIPEPSCDDPYVIQRGDTLGGLAKKHDTTVDEILKENKDIKDPDKIYAGYELKIPGRKPQEECPVPPKGGPEKQEPVKIEEPKDKKKIEEPKKQEPEKIEEPKDKKKIEEPKKQEPEKKEEPKDKKKIEEPKKQEPEKIEEPKAEEQLPEDKDKPCEDCTSSCDVKIWCEHEKRAYSKKAEYFGVVPSKKGKSKHPWKQKLTDELLLHVRGSQAPSEVTYGGEKNSQVINGEKNGDLTSFKIKSEYQRVASGSSADTLIAVLKVIGQLAGQKNYVEKNITGTCIGTIPVRVYNPDEWELSIMLPAWRKQGIGISRILKEDKGKRTYEKAKYDFKQKQQTTETDTYQYAKGRPRMEVYDSSEVQQGTLARKDAIEVKLNGHPIKNRSIDSLGAVLNYAEQVNHLVELIQAIADKKVGFYINVNIQIFQGGIFLKLKNKENEKDHRVYLNGEVGINLTILSIAVEAGLGMIVASDYYAKVYIKIEGKAEVIGKLELDSPDAERKFKIESKTTFVPEIGVAIKAGDWIEVVVKGSSGLEVSYYCDLNIDDEDKMFVIGAESKFLGVEVEASYKLAVGSIKKSGTFKEKLIEESELGKIEFPSEEEFKPDEIPPSAIRKIFIDQFKEGFDLVFIKKISLSDRDMLSRRTMTKKYKEIDVKVASENILMRLLKENTLKRNEKSIRGIAQDIDTILREKSYSGLSTLWRDHIDYDKFIKFIESEKFKKILDKYRSSAKVMRNTLEKSS